jgi:hypothetical protein
LTDLGPYMSRRPMVHGRSISEPTADITMGHRTEFSNSSPPSQKANIGLNGYAMAVNAPVTPESSRSLRQNGWLSHSPFMSFALSPVSTQAPLPSHMKRGTLAFQVSPVRALRKQRSMHSLRRHVTSATNRSNSAASRGQKTERSDSGETIQVLMSTPEHPPQVPAATLSSATYQPRSAMASPSSQSTTIITRPGQTSRRAVPTDQDPTPIASMYQQQSCSMHARDQTPTRPGKNANVPHIGATLGLRSPYSPSTYANRSNDQLAVPDFATRSEQRRKMDSLWPPPGTADGGEGHGASWRLTAATTFEGLMEKAGLRRSVMCMGPDPREWNK